MVHADELLAATIEYKEAAEALHTSHSTTDVHGKGGVAGQGFTDHCAWACHALNGKIVNGRVVSLTNPLEPIHKKALDRYEAAKAALEALIAGVEPA